MAAPSEAQKGQAVANMALDWSLKGGRSQWLDMEVIVAIVSGLAIRIAYWLYVNPVWEDAYISLRIVENFIDNGVLGYNTEEKVYGFTSPFNTLLVTLPFHWLIPGAGITATRIASLVAFVPMIVYANAIARHDVISLTPLARRTWLALLVCYMPIIYFSMGGMETQFATLFALGTLASTLYHRDGMLGLWLGLGLLTRPDFAILAAVVLLLRLGECPRGGVRAGLLSAVIYLPWLGFSWAYFGSPVPNTIKAKALIGGPEFSMSGMLWIAGKIFSPTTSEHLSAVAYTGVAGYSLCLAALVCISFFAIRHNASSSNHRGMGRNGKWTKYACPAFVCAYWLYMTLAWAHAPWYHVPAFAVAAVLCPLSVQYLGAKISAPHLRKIFLCAALAFIALPHIAYASLKPQRDKLVQRYIEDGVRTKVGLWLRQRVSLGETLCMEPIGYIGYFAGLGVTIHDWPGLISPRSVAVLESLSAAERGLFTLVNRLRPEWVVVRDANYRSGIASASSAFLREEYAIAERFTVHTEAPQHFYLQNNMDANFLVLRRK